MLSPTPLQTATGGSPFVVALALVSLFVTALLSLIVAYRLVRGYRQNRNRARLYLALGLVFLTTGPIVLQFVLTNFTDLSRGLRSIAANTTKLVGLAAMLYAIFGVTQSRKRLYSDPDGGPGTTPDRSTEVEP